MPLPPPTGVEVHARSTQSGCASIFRGDAVIITAPLGVLKAGALTFHPPLPEWKTQAINNLGFGLLNKVLRNGVSSIGLHAQTTGLRPGALGRHETTLLPSPGDPVL